MCEFTNISDCWRGNSCVSVIIPCYNTVTTIGETIESVIDQTYPDWEMIVIDDCSTDGSDILIKKYCGIDQRIKYLRTDLPSGSPTLPRNIGTENARGRFIAFLDSDDLWLPGKLEDQVRLFEAADSRVAVVFSNYEKISARSYRSQREIIAAPETDYYELLKGDIIGNLTAAYDVAKVGKVYFENVGHEDYVLWLAILKRGFTAKNTNTIAALYRVRKHSVSSNKFIAAGWQWNIYINIEKTGYIKGTYYFIHYACRALLKFLK